MISLISPGQWAYLIALALLFWWRGPSFAAWVLLANAVATLAVLGAMDWGLLGHTEKTLFLMLIDFASGAVLLTSPGLPRVLAVGYGIIILVYPANIIFGVSEGTTFAIVIGIGILQIVVAGIGYGGDGGGGLRRYSDGPHLVALPGRNSGLGAPVVAEVSGGAETDRRGVARGQ